jgi:hypothetical protein
MIDAIIVGVFVAACWAAVEAIDVTLRKFFPAVRELLTEPTQCETVITYTEGAEHD